MYTPSKVAMAIVFGLGLSACGGSSTSKEEPITPPAPVNTPPSISIENASAEEKSDVTISATVTDDGSIVSYLWSQVSGTVVELSGDTTDSLSFTAPSVSSNEELVFSLTATDNDGAETSSEVTISITQKTITLNINGVVTDSPIANANLIVSIGDKDYEVSADENGAYLAELTLDDDQASDFVSIIAQGIEAQKIAKLQSLLGTVNALNTQAGDDGIVDKSENFSVNITNYSTAKAALILQQVIGETKLTDEKLLELTSNINAWDMFRLAVALKVAIDKSADNDSLKLPEGVNDTLELALDHEKRQMYVEMVAHTAEFEAASQEMIADENVMNTPETAISETYFFPLTGLYAQLYQDDSNQGDLFIGTKLVPFVWQKNADGFTFNFTDNSYVRSSGYKSVTINGEEANVYFEEVVQSINFQILSVDNTTMTLAEVANTAIIYPDGELTNEESQSDSITQAITAEHVADFVLPTDANSQFILPLPNGFFEIEHVSYQTSDIFTFNTDGSGMVKNLGQEFTWQYGQGRLAKDKQDVYITLSDGTELWYALVVNAQQQQHYAVQIKQGDKEAGTLNTGGLIDENDAFNPDSVAGIYSFDTDGKSLNEWWWELWPSGKAYTVSTNDANNDGSLSADEVSVQYGDWFVNEKGELAITRWKYPGSSWLSGCFGDTGEGCYLYNERRWKMYGKDGDVFYVLNDHNFDFNEDGAIDARYLDNRRPNKSTARPTSVQLPESYYLPSQPPMSLPSLLSVSDFTEQTLFSTKLDTMLGDSVVQSIMFSGDMSFNAETETQSTGDKVIVTGSYRSINDSTLILSDESNMRSNFAFFSQSNDVILGIYNGMPTPYFSSKELASQFIEDSKNKVVAKSFADWIGQEIYLAEENEEGVWELTYFKLDDQGNVNIYEDESFQSVVESIPYKVNDDGSATFAESDSLFIILSTDKFNLAASNTDSATQFDGNYLFTDLVTAKDFVVSMSQLSADVSN